VHRFAAGWGRITKIKMLKSLSSRKGQLGPQALEDIPVSLMALIMGMVIAILLFSTVFSNMDSSSRGELFSMGKRQVESRLFSLLSSEYSRTYGTRVIDVAVLESMTEEEIASVLDTVEYSYYLNISSWPLSTEFGEKPSEDTVFAFMSPGSIYSNRAFYDASLTTYFWRK
jgi:hypothetical protein